MTISVTIIIIAITGLVSWRALENSDLTYKLMHFPYEESKNREFYRWITAVFVHGSWIHLAVNMFVLWSFGSYIEEIFEFQLFGGGLGKVYFLLLYLCSGVFANLPTYLKNRNNPGFSSVGASGATSGIMFSYALLFPWNSIYLFGVIPLPAILAAALYLVYSSYASKNDRASRIDHEAHFWGAVFGFVFTGLLKPSLFADFLRQIVEVAPFS